MRRIYAIVCGLALLSSYGVAKAEKIHTKHKTEKSIQKNTKTSKTTSSDYKIKSGDSLYTIAQKNHIGVAELESINHIKKGGKLKIGSSLKLSKGVSEKTKDKKTSTASAKNKTKTKITQSGKTKKSTEIASKSKSDIVISTTKKSALTQISGSHTIKKGETLYSIAKKYHIDVAALKKTNSIKSNNLKLGQTLTIPRNFTTFDAPMKIAKIDTKTEKVTTLSRDTSSKRFILESEQEESTLLSFLGQNNKTCSPSLKLDAAKDQLGKNYVLGASGPYAFDCSGFTSYVCKANGVCLPRTSIEQSRVGKKIARNELKAGDLIFFDTSTRRRGYVNHVGIYLGDNKFIHASSSKKKVIITSLDSSFYKSRFKWGSRVKG